jgi:hypothetical protein
VTVDAALQRLLATRVELGQTNNLASDIVADTFRSRRRHSRHSQFVSVSARRRSRDWRRRSGRTITATHHGRNRVVRTPLK